MTLEISKILYSNRGSALNFFSSVALDVLPDFVPQICESESSNRVCRPGGSSANRTGCYLANPR